MGETMALLPSDSHYQAAINTIAHKYNLSGVFYIDLWPAACGQLIVIDPDVALHMTVTRNHPKHEAEKWFIDPLIGSNNIVTTEDSQWKYLHKMLSPAFSIQHISNMRAAVCCTSTSAKRSWALILTGRGRDYGVPFPPPETRPGW